MDKKPNVVVAFAFGAPADIYPNEMLAKRAVQAAIKFEIPIVTQIEYYDSQSIQFWTRHKWVNWLREKILLTLPWSIYKKIARGK